MDNILFWFGFFKDKKFSIRFKLANLIMNDYLRNYLAVGCLLPLENSLKYIEAETDSEKHLCQKMEEVADTIKDIFEI